MSNNKNKKKKIIIVIFVLILVGLFGYFVYNYFKNETNITDRLDETITNNDDKVIEGKVDETNINNDDKVSEDKVDEAVIKTGDKVIDDLYILSKKDNRIKTIIDNKNNYPNILLKMLSNNIDMTDYVLNYTEKVGQVFSDNIGSINKGEYPLLLQYDVRWGYGYYGDSIIAISGCGPTVLSMVVAGLTGRNDVTPYSIAQYAYKNGYYKSGSGTSWSIMTEGIRQYNIKGKNISLSKSSIMNELNKGHPIVCSMRPGDFTTTGHYILITGIKDGKFVINDPNSEQRSQKLWTYEEIYSQIKNLWAFEK